MQPKFIILAGIFGVITGLCFSTNQNTLLSIGTALVASVFGLAAYFSKDKKDQQIDEIHTFTARLNKERNMDGKPVPTINASNSVFSVNQQGGVTAHTVNINEFPEPKFELKPIKSNIPQDSVFITEALFLIESKAAISNLYLEAKSPSIVDFKASPQRTGMAMFGHTGKREGFAFTNVRNAYGTYMLRIVTSKPDSVEIIYNYE